MPSWTVTDRHGREIYLTQERWEHIISKHPELNGPLEDVLITIRLGRRKSSKRDPQTFFLLVPKRAFDRTLRYDISICGFPLH